MVLPTDPILKPRVQARLPMAMARVGMALERAKQPAVAFSGGKDSLVVLALVQLFRPGVPVIWSDDELEYPETVGYIERLAEQESLNLMVVAGWAQHAGWFRPWSNEPYWREPLPGTLRIDCRVEDWQAAEGYDMVFTGLRASESRKRRIILQQGQRATRRLPQGNLRCDPILDWTTDDVWGLIAGWGLPYNPVYDRLESIGVPRDRARVGPLPLTPCAHLQEGWPDLYRQLVDRYGERWL